MGSRSSSLDPEEGTKAHATVKPEITIADTPCAAQPHLFGRPDDSEQVRDLDRRQGRPARRIGGYRLIRGVADSGKTLILTHRVSASATLARLAHPAALLQQGTLGRTHGRDERRRQLRLGTGGLRETISPTPSAKNPDCANSKTCTGSRPERRIRGERESPFPQCWHASDHPEPLSSIASATVSGAAGGPLSS